MLKKEEYLHVEKRPSISDMDLKELVGYYEEYLMDRVFYYKLNDGKEINLEFKKDKLCHLLGIHYFAPNRKLSYMYRSFRGFESIKEGDITIQKLKKINKKAFKEHKERIVFFPFMYQLLLNCECLYFNNKSVDGSCVMQFEIALHQEFDNKMLHLGIEIENNNECYFPKTFFISRGDNKKKYLDNQKHTNIVEKKIIMKEIDAEMIAD